MNGKKKKSIRPVIYLALVAVIAVAVSVTVVSSKKENVTIDVIMGKIENASELTSAKMICTGLKHYSDGKIPFLTEEAFSMTYSATVRAGIDMDKLDVKVTHSKVIINVPEVEIQDINIDDDSIQFYDKKFSFFSGDSKEDVIAARKEIKKDVQEKVEVQELKKTAKMQIEVLLRSLFEDSIGDRELEIRFEE